MPWRQEPLLVSIFQSTIFRLRHCSPKFRWATGNSGEEESSIGLRQRKFGSKYDVYATHKTSQVTGLDAWASSVKCPARFVSHLYDIYIFVYSFCLFSCLFFIVTWWYVWSIVWASGNQKKVQACMVALWLFIILCYSLYKTTPGLLCSWRPVWSLKKHPHSMRLKPIVKMCIFVVIQIFWSLRKYIEQ